MFRESTLSLQFCYLMVQSALTKNREPHEGLCSGVENKWFSTWGPSFHCGGHPFPVVLKCWFYYMLIFLSTLDYFIGARARVCVCFQWIIILFIYCSQLEKRNSNDDYRSIFRIFQPSVPTLHPSLTPLSQHFEGRCPGIDFKGERHFHSIEIVPTVWIQNVGIRFPFTDLPYGVLVLVLDYSLHCCIEHLLDLECCESSMVPHTAVSESQSLPFNHAGFKEIRIKEYTDHLNENRSLCCWLCISTMHSPRVTYITHLTIHLSNVLSFLRYIREAWNIFLIFQKWHDKFM